MYFGDELGDSPIPSESGAGSESGSGSPASEVSLKGVRRPNNSIGHPGRV